MKLQIFAFIAALEEAVGVQIRNTDGLWWIEGRHMRCAIGLAMDHHVVIDPWVHHDTCGEYGCRLEVMRDL